MFNLHVEPRVVKSWIKFLRNNPRYSIALDGYVRGPPRFDPLGPRVNYNHHEGVDGLSTRSTCAQVYFAIKRGLFRRRFVLDGEPNAEIYVNDPDPDTCLALWLIMNHLRTAGSRSEQLINRLVDVEDKLDVTGGTWQFDPNSLIMQEIAWIFAPYFDSRMQGQIQTMDERTMKSTIGVVCSRISDYANGGGQTLEVDTRFEEFGGGPGWSLVKEIGPYSRLVFFTKGIEAFVSFRERGERIYDYSLGRISPYEDFSLQAIYRRLNEVEGLSSATGNFWSGGNNFGGSPRETGSRLTPKRLTEEINRLLIELRRK